MVQKVLLVDKAFHKDSAMLIVLQEGNWRLNRRQVIFGGEHVNQAKEFSDLRLQQIPVHLLRSAEIVFKFNQLNQIEDKRTEGFVMQVDHFHVLWA